MLTVAYGSYVHPPGECVVSISYAVSASDSGLPVEEVHTWQIDGTLQGTGPADLAAQSAALRLAYTPWFRSASFMAPGGVVINTLPNAGSLSGVRVTGPPSFPGGGPGDLATQRAFRITLSATYAVGIEGGGGEPAIKEFRQSISRSGGGPKRGMVELVTGPPVPYTYSDASIFYATQSGSAIGTAAYPVPPAAIWPTALVAAEITHSRPRLENGFFRDYGVTWSYRFEGPAAFAGSP